MSQFDVFHAKHGAGYLLDCQSDLLSQLNTRFCVPLLPPEIAPAPARRLNPSFEIEQREVIMVTQFAAAIPVRDLSEQVATLAERRYLISNALDMLITGY